MLHITPPAVREATEDDLPALLDIAQRFHDRGRIPVPLCLDSVAATLQHLMASDLGVVFVAGAHGAAGALLHPSWMNASHLTGQELFWWSDQGDGALLFGALENWARSKGANSFAMIALEACRPSAVGALYRRRGYLPAEHSYLKVF